MKQNTTVFLGIVLASLMLFTLCSANDQCCNLNTVRVSGNGKIQVEADIAIIYAYINQDGATVA